MSITTQEEAPTEYQVTVYTTVRETYYVTAASETEARDIWMDRGPDATEFQSTDRVEVSHIDQ